MTAPTVPLRLVVQRPREEPILLEGQKIRDQIAEVTGFKSYLEKIDRWAKQVIAR